MGGTSGTASIRNPTLTLGNTNNTIVTNSGTTNYLAISPYGHISLAPNSTAFSDGSLTTLTVTNDVNGAGQVQIAGGDLYLGVKSIDEFNFSASNIIFEGSNFNVSDTTLTVLNPTASRTISLPDASGTVALTSGLVSSLSGSTFISVSGSTGAVTITNTGVQTFNGLTGAVTGVTVGGTNVFTALNTFNAGISAAGGVTFSGNLKGVTATFSGNLTTTGSLTTLGDVPSGVTSYNNDTVAIVGDYYESAFAQLTGSTTGSIARFYGANSIKVTVNCFATIFASGASKNHVFNISCNMGEIGVNSFDYTESIVGSAWPGVVFTLSADSNGFNTIMTITASTPALDKFQSQFYFETSIVRVSN
jgi:hypothetical protein